MATVSSDVVAQDTLTGGGIQDEIRNATGTEFHVIRFINITSSTVSIKLWLNGTDDVNLISPPDATFNNSSRKMLVLKVKMGADDILYAEAGDADSIVWTDEMDRLS